MLLIEIDRSIQAAILDVLASRQWQHYEGPSNKRLALSLAERVGQSHLQLFSSGTAALEIVLRAAGIGAGDEVLMASYDYPGNFWAIERVGARPVLVDTLPNSWRVDFESLERSFQPSCKALIVSHLHGELQKVDELRMWCDRRKMLLFEDVCQAIGASWNGSSVGSYGHAAILSFGGGKLLSCGRGGALATSDETLAIKARVAAGSGSGPYEMSELQAATILAQLPWLDEINSTCRTFFNALDHQLKLNACDWIFVPESCLSTSVFYQCGWQTNGSLPDDHRQELLEALRAEQMDQSGAVVELPFGVGFPGFHRRSSRRCRISGSLSCASSASNRTIVLHHRVALRQQFTPEQIANFITASISKIH